MKKSKLLAFIPLLSIMFSSGTQRNQKILFVAAHEAENISEEIPNQESLFVDKKIEDYGYLYNYDDHSDYIYVDFEGTAGYAIFADNTLEILEYTKTGDFPYASDFFTKYYGGPGAYFKKNGNQFINTISDQSITVSDINAKEQSKLIRQSFGLGEKSVEDSKTASESLDIKIETLVAKNLAVNSSSAEYDYRIHSPSNPPLDGSNWISPTEGASYITNSEYFLTAGVSPRHGDNNLTSCTTVATQLMLSYNNFYNDRRLIAPEHLHGGWKTNGNGNRFDRSNYNSPERDPNVSLNPEIMTSYTLGANQEHHDFLLSIGVTGYLSDADDQLRMHLDEKNINYTLTEKHTPLNGLFTIGSSDILAEINAGRPLVLATSKVLNGTPHGQQREFNHSVLAYGYQTFAPYADSGNNTNYLGYIVHMGWDGNGSGSNTNVWTNSAWYYSYMALEINHTHNYTIYTGNTYENGETETRCGYCGHRKSVDLYNVSGSTIISPKYALTGEVTIPSELYGTSITAIAGGAFNGQTQLTKITIPNSVVSIGSNSFLNTGGAPIHLLGRTTAPAEFNVNWNPSNNSVFLNGVKCTHTIRTLINLSSTQHGLLCNKCRTASNKSSHSYTYNYAWSNYNQHRSICECSATKNMGHVVSSSDPGFPYKTCLHCGGPADTGFGQARLLTIPGLTLNTPYIIEYFGNDSYLLSNGVAVLSDEDLTSYLSGALIIPACQECNNDVDEHGASHIIDIT